MTVSWHTDVRILKFSFFQRLIVIELLVSETIKKNSSNLLPPRTFFFPTFLFADNGSQKQTGDDVLKNGC